MATDIAPNLLPSDTASTRRTVSAVFYGGLTVLLVLIVAGVHKQVLPDGAASNLGNNSEGFFFALVMGLWIQYARPRVLSASAWLWPALAAVAGCSIGIWLLNSSLPSRIATLQEPALALGLLIPYVTVRRPLPLAIPAAIVGGTLITMVVGIAVGAPSVGGTLGLSNWVITQAETLGFILLTPIALDFIDRGILQRSATTSRWLRRCFYVTLAVLPMLVIAAGTDRRTGNGIVALALNYVGRVHESFIGVLLVVLYFAVGLGWRGRPAGTGAAAEVAR